MSEVTKQKVLSIDTNKAQKNVKSLKQVIKELREEMALLEKGSAEYDAMSKKLADAMQKQREIAEAAKYSNKDIGAVLGNIATIGAGAVGAINGVSAALQLVGVSGEDAEEALKNIQLTMALIQGMSALDTAIKAVKGLGVAFKGLNGERIAQTGATVGATAAETAEIVALKENTKKTYENIEAAGAYNEAQEGNIEKTNESTDALVIEAKQMEINTAARAGQIEKVKELEAELAKLKAGQEVAKNKGISNATKTVTGGLEQLIKDNEEMLAKLPNGNQTLEKQISEYKRLLQAVKDGTMTTAEVTSMAWRKLSYDLKEAVEGMADDSEIKQIESWMNSVAQAMSPEEIGRRIDDIQEEMEGVVSNFYQIYPKEMVDNNEMLRNMLNDQTEAYRRQLAQLQPLYVVKTSMEKQERQLKNELFAAKEAADAETASLKANSKEKLKNAGATKGLAGAEGNLNKSMTASIPLQTKIATGFKNMGKAIGDFIAANPILLLIAAAIAAIAGAIIAYTKSMKNANAEIKLFADLTANINEQYDEQRVRIYTLTSALEDNNSSMDERRKAVEELNKIVPNYNAELDETTGKYTANKQALDEYLEKLYQKIKLEVYEGKIKEYLQQQLELQEKINKMENNGWKGWNKFWGRITKAKNDIQDLDSKINQIFKHINDEIDLSKALDDNKVENNLKKVVVKTFKEIVTNIRNMVGNIWDAIFNEKELVMTFNGIYSDVNMAMLKLERVITSNNLGGMLTDEFKEAIKNGFDGIDPVDITLDFVITREATEKFQKQLDDELERLEKMKANENGTYTDEDIKAQEDRIAELKKEGDLRKSLMDLALGTTKAVKAEKEAQENLNKAKKEYNAQLEIERTYRYEKRGGNDYADINKEIAVNEQLVKTINERIKAREDEQKKIEKLTDANNEKIKELQENTDKSKEEENKKEIERLENQNKEMYERQKQYRQQEFDDYKALENAKLALDDANYQARLKYVEEYYENAKEQAEASTAELENNRTLKGWGVVDYNTQLDILKMSLKAIEDTINETAAYYDREIALAGDNAEKRVELEAEKLEALRQLNADYAAQEIEIEKAKIDRKIAIQQTYTNAMETITGEVQSLLQTQMANYDQNSKQYKKLAVANGIIDVTKGTLSAFMSGIESGVPAPWNLVVAGVMSALVFATGMAQLNNIKNATAANATSGSSNVSFGSYDTMTYAQNSDILSSISDQRVYVLESDITSTQNRVQVTESNATF